MRKRIIGILLAIAVLASLIAVLPVNAETPGPLKQVVITPSTVTLPVGGTQQFSAQGQADNHVPIPNLTYTWAVAGLSVSQGCSRQATCLAASRTLCWSPLTRAAPSKLALPRLA